MFPRFFTSFRMTKGVNKQIISRKYIKQEVPDMKKTGEQKVFYRMKVERNIDFEEFIRKVCSHHTGITRGEALRVLK